MYSFKPGLALAPLVLCTAFCASAAAEGAQAASDPPAAAPTRLYPAAASSSATSSSDDARRPVKELAHTEVIGIFDPNDLAQPNAASTGLVTRQRIRNLPISRPAEVLEVVPGLIATQHSGDGKANQYFLRGFNLDHGTDLSTRIDGVPNNLRTHAHGQGYNDLNGLIPELIDSVEYRKGPYYAEDGDFSSAGAVRIHYVKQLERPFAQLTAGEHGYRRALLAGSGQTGDQTILLGALDTGVYDGPWTKPENERRYSFVGKLTHGDSQRGFGLEALGYHNRWDSSDQIPRRAVRSGLISRFGQIDKDLGGETSRYTLAGNYHQRLGPGYLLANAYAARYRLNLYSDFTYFLDDPVNGDQFEQYDSRNYYGGSLKYVQRWKAAGIEQELSAGVETRVDDIGTTGLYHTRARQRIGTVREDSVIERSAAAFVSYEARLADWLRTVAGLRTDAYQADVDSTIAVNSGSASDQRASPKLAVVLGPWASTEIFLNAGRGFHSNDARGTTLNVDPNNPAEPARALDLLVPTTGSEIGLRTSPSTSLSFSAALWQLRIGSELVFSGDGGTTEASRASRRSGLELSMNWQPRDWLAVNVDYAHSNARFTQPDPAGQHIPGAIERVASVGATLQNLGRWSGGVRYRFLGAAPLIEDNSARSSPTRVVNAQAGYALTSRIKLKLEVLNLLGSDDNDITYYYASQLAGESQPVDDYHFHPVEPRDVRLSIRVEL